MGVFMNKQLRQLIIIIGIVLVLGGAFIFLTRTREIPQNPDTLVGNTAGNLNNGGYFCQDGDMVYFANAYDNNCLYSMNVDETNMQKLSKSQVKYINAGGDYLYYFQENSTSTLDLGFVRQISGVYRLKKDGSDSFCISSDLSGIVKLVGNNLFYQHYDNTSGMTLYKSTTNKGNEEEIADYIINPSSYGIGYIFFNGTNDNHNLYQLNVNTNNITAIWDGNVWNPTYHHGYIYYMNISDNYKLCRYSFQDRTVETLTTDRLDHFNIYENTIYYQKSSSSDPALKRMNLDGSNPEIVDEGNFQNVNITSEFVYYNEFGIPMPVYKTPTTGPIDVQTFAAGMHGVEVSD
jgi:hypothetical protein